MFPTDEGFWDGMSVHFEPDRKRYVVRWREGGRNRSRRFRAENDAVAFDNAVHGRVSGPASGAPGVADLEAD
jgi:hypothetical protein